MNISRMNQRRKRQKNSKPATLNLVSLMDIFTILVFFLMVNSSEVEVVELEANIKLPDSTAQQRPEDRLLISVNADDLIVQGTKVASIDALMASESETIPELRAALVHHLEAKTEDSLASTSPGSSSQGASRPDVQLQENAVTILGDRELPYQLLKRIMLTCQRADFTRIALAVNRTTDDQASLSNQTTIGSKTLVVANATDPKNYKAVNIGGANNELHG